MESEYFESLYPADTHQKAIEKIVTYIKEGKSCQLLGLPGVGRSTLLSLLAYNRQVRKKHFGNQYASFHFVLVNFSEIRKRSLFDVMKFLFLNLTESLRERKMTEEHRVVGNIFREHLQFQDELILFQGFKEAIDYLCLVKKITVVFLFDRFEEYLPTVTTEFFTNLRTLRSRAKYQFSVVFSLYRPLETFVEPAILADYYEFVAENVIYLPLLDKPATDFRVASIEKITGKQIPQAQLTEIMKLSGNVGRLVKLSVEVVLANPSQKDLSSLLLSQRTIRSALQEIWSILSPAEQADLLQGKFDNEEVAAYLDKIGLIRGNKIQIPLFESFIKETFTRAMEQTAKIVYDEKTNVIRKGHDVLSDQLTASEFRLLRYLLQKQEQVVDRESLIEVVWESNKSTAGITDQAVDQLIFRLRRKIEEDANNPTHLLTVKGRGFKFVA